jgi:SOUL heme-binding protein
LLFVKINSISISLMLALISSLFAGCGKSTYESPAYQVIERDGAFEIRDYPELTLVSTHMEKRGEDGSFMKLFRFISGRNDHSQKISMTTPVLMSGTESGTMSFIVPKAVAKHGVPAPTNPDVSVSTTPPARYAAYRFSGPSKPGPSEAASRKLLDWAASKKLPFTSTPIYAYYNPPWTPGFLRRNEVLLHLSGKGTTKP